MDKRRVVSLAIFLALVLPAMLFGQTKLLRHPSYNKGKVAFSYLGDIWVANEDGSAVERLTVHKARDIYPRFSPDGKWIAFSSNREGNYDVYVIPVAGGPAKQLTFNTAADTVVGWTPDSTKVLFTSGRSARLPGVANLYEVPVTGGLEQIVPTDWGTNGSFSPDGKKLAFSRHPGVWWRKHYRGSYAVDLWLLDTAANKFTKLGDPDYKGGYFWPMYGNNGEIYFVADILPNEKAIKPGSREVMKSVNNIWKISDRGGKPVQVTKFTDGNLFFPSISADGKTIVFEENFGIWKLDTASGKTSEIKINIVSDEKENFVETLAFQNEADSFSLSPSGKRAAITIHGEIFTVPTDRGEVQQVTKSYSRETTPMWSPDGKWIAYVSDKTNQQEVWISDEFGKNQKKLSAVDTEKRDMEWAPDSKSLFYTASDHNLYRVDVESGKTDTVAHNDISAISGIAVSPDGAWVAYSAQDNDMRSHVYVVAATGGQPRMIGGEDIFSATGPAWTPDGKKLIFLAGIRQGGMATQRAQMGTMQLYSVSLLPEEKDPLDQDIDSEAEAMAAAETARRPRAGGPGGGQGEQAAGRRVEVKIDWNGLNERVRQVTRLSENVSGAVPSPDSRLYAFVSMGANGGIYTIQDDGERLTRVVGASGGGAGRGEGAPPGARGGGFGGGLGDIQWTRDGRSIFYRDGRGISTVAIGGGAAGGNGAAAGGGAAGGGAAAGGAAAGAGRAGRRLTFSIHVEVDHRAEWKQAVDESWRVMKHRFYDAEMHGADWNKVRATYEPLVDYVADQEQMHDIVSLMLGELNASHTGISGRERPEAGIVTPQTRYPGFEIEPDASGFFKVTHVYKNGPADKEFIRIHVGDYVLALNEQDLKAGENYWERYNKAAGRKAAFLVNSKPAKEGAWTATVEWINGGAQTTLQYEKWVAERKAMVDKLSNGEIGYLHIRAMDAPSLAKFQREIIENHFKKALIIDQRFNGGGGIDEQLLEILSQRQYQMTQPRGSVKVDRPQQAFFGPMVVMENERSASDAEMFPDGFKTLGLGKVVGVTTYGAVIATGSFTLLDGSSLRTPGSGVYNVKGYNLENYGVPPDVYIDNAPEDILGGRDAQIEKAVEVLKAELQAKTAKK
jgi:tricorn protease